MKMILLIYLLICTTMNAQLTEHSSYNIDSRIEGTVEVVSEKVFTSQDHANAIYVWNPSFWASDINRDAVSPWNSEGGATRAGVLISPQHYIAAKHFPIPAGSTIRFVKSTGEIIERTVLAVKNSPQDPTVPQTPIPDINIGLLDQPIFNIEPLKILPFSANSTLNYQYVPLIWFDKEEKGNVANLETPHDTFYHVFWMTMPIYPSQRWEYYEEAISGDSGSPAFMIVNDKLVLVGLLTFGGQGAGTALNYYKSDTQAMMDSLSTQYGFPLYSLEDADFSNIGIPPEVFPDVPLFLYDMGSGLTLYWKATSGYDYYVEESLDLQNWYTISNKIIGNDQDVEFPVQTQNASFWRLKMVSQISLQQNFVNAVSSPPPENLKPIIDVFVEQASFETNTPFEIQYRSSGGDGAVGWSMRNNPSWLKMFQGLVYYSGNPKNSKYAGSYTIDIIVTDSDGDFDSVTLSLEIIKGQSGDSKPGHGKGGKPK